MQGGKKPQVELAPQDIAKFKGAFRLVVNDVGGVVPAGAMLGLSHVHVSRMQNVNDPTLPTWERVVALESLDGVDPHFTRAMADHCGHVLIALPQVSIDGRWIAMLGEIAKDTGVVVAAVAEALADDGLISGREIVDLDIERKCDEAIREITRFREAVRAHKRAEKDAAKTKGRGR